MIEYVSMLANPLVIPEPVAVEIAQVREEDAASRWLKAQGRQFIRPATVESPELSRSGIGAGERAVISWAVANHGFTVVLDDQEARIAARKLDLHVLGTIGVVLRLKQAGLISEAKTALSKIRSLGGYMSDALLREALQRAGEHL